MRRGTERVLRRLVIAAAGMAVLGMAGCGMKKDFDRSRMLSYMSRKYGEEFDFVEDYAGQMGKDYTMILAAARKDPEQKTLVRISKKDGRECFEDNYPAWRLKGELEKKIGAVSEQCFGTCKVYYKVPEFVFPEEFGADMDAEEFLQHPFSMAQFYIYPEEISGSRESWEKKLTAFGERIAASGYWIRGTISLPQSRKDYDGITERNFDRSDYQGYEPYAELVFSLDGDGSFRYMRWLKGKERKREKSK